MYDALMEKKLRLNLCQVFFILNFWFDQFLFHGVTTWTINVASFEEKLVYLLLIILLIISKLLEANYLLYCIQRVYSCMWGIAC
jgi:hypothetical protein